MGPVDLDNLVFDLTRRVSPAGKQRLNLKAKPFPALRDLELPWVLSPRRGLYNFSSSFHILSRGP